MQHFKFKTLAWLFAHGLFAVNIPSARATPALAEAAGELISLIEKADPLVKERKQNWQAIERSLRSAGLQAETPAGFKLSATRILSAWEGRGVRILDATDAQFYAASPVGKAIPDSGAWYAPKGAKWYVKQVSKRPEQQFRRGDELVQSGFHPTQYWTGAAEQSISVREQPLADAAERKIKVKATTLDAWALAETQAASSVIPLDGKRLCQEKVWLWLSRPVSVYLQSKISFSQANCDALLVDLRDAFGDGPRLKNLKGKRQIPVVVLVNQESRESAVAYALQLKEEMSARILGEPTASKLMPLETVEMKKLEWSVVFYESASGSLLPDQIVSDSWIYGAGIDGLADAGLQELKKQLK